MFTLGVGLLTTTAGACGPNPCSTHDPTVSQSVNLGDLGTAPAQHHLGTGTALIHVREALTDLSTVPICTWWRRGPGQLPTTNIKTALESCLSLDMRASPRSYTSPMAS